MPLRVAFSLLFFAFGSVASARVLLTLFALHLGAQPATVGALMATFYLCPLLLSWPIGILADRYGARWLVFAGTLCGLVGMLLAGTQSSLAALFAAAGLAGLAFAFYLVTLQNLIGIMSRPEDRARNFGTFSVIGAITNFIGPLIAGFAVDHLGHVAATFVVAALPLGGALVVVFLGSVLPGPVARSPSGQGSVLELLADRDILRVLALGGLVQLGTDLYQFYIPIYGHGLGLSASAIGSVLASFAAASFIVRFALTRVIARYGEERVLASAFFFGAAGFALVPLCHHPATLAVTAFVFGLGMGCGQPITTMLMFSRSAAGRSGELLGVRLTANNLMRVAGPAVFGAIASSLGLVTVFVINALMMASGGYAARPRGRTPKP